MNKQERQENAMKNAKEGCEDGIKQINEIEVILDIFEAGITIAGTEGDEPVFAFLEALRTCSQTTRETFINLKEDIRGLEDIPCQD